MTEPKELEEIEIRKKCTNCGKSFSTKLGLTSLCGDCEDSVKEGELYG